MQHPIGAQFRVSQHFLQEDAFTRKIYRSGVHFGTDFACPGGTILRAPADATVVEVIKNNPTMGNCVRLEVLYDGMLTSHRFMHLSSILAVSGPVKQGTVLGKTGNTGKGASYHLHWDIMKGHFVFNNLLSKQSIIDTMLDPIKWLTLELSEKLNPLDDASTQMLVDELITRADYKQVLLERIKQQS